MRFKLLTHSARCAGCEDLHHRYFIADEAVTMAEILAHPEENHPGFFAEAFSAQHGETIVGLLNRATVN